MNACAVFTEALYELDAGETDPGLIVRWHEHRAVCADCDALAETYRLTVVLGRRLPAPEPPASLTAALVRMLAADPG